MRSLTSALLKATLDNVNFNCQTGKYRYPKTLALNHSLYTDADNTDVMYMLNKMFKLYILRSVTSEKPMLGLFILYPETLVKCFKIFSFTTGQDYPSHRVSHLSWIHICRSM